MSTIKRPQSYKRLQSFAVTSGLFGTTSSSVDKKTEIGRIKDQFEELPELMKNHKINAAYNPNEHRNTQNNPMFRKWRCISVHTITIVLKITRITSKIMTLFK